MDANTKLIWLDMEMSGLEVKSSVILQIAIIITDATHDFLCGQKKWHSNY